MMRTRARALIPVQESRLPPGAIRAGARSFTLVELLVAVAVLSLLLVFIAQFVSMTSHTTVNDGKRIDALSQARLALDRFGIDWNARLTRSDIALRLVKSQGSDEIAFATQMPSPSGTRTLAVVDYRVNPSAASGDASGRSAWRLERGIAGFDWAGANGFPFPLAATNYPYSPGMADTNFQTLAPGIFRLEFCLLLKAATNSPAAYWSPDAPSAVTNVDGLAAIVVAVAALDEGSRKLVDASRLQSLAAALPDVAPGAVANGDPVAAWRPCLTNAATLAALARVPLPVAQAVRVYERYFYAAPVP